MATQTLLTTEQFLGLPEEEGKIRELDEGRLAEMAPPNFVHAVLTARIARLIGNYIEESDSKLWVAEGSGFRLAVDTHRIPDVFVIRDDTARSMQANAGWYAATPDLAIEVVSPSDKAEDLDRRVYQYLGAGSHAVWVVYPETRHVMVYQAGGTALDLREGDALTVPGLLPELSIAVSGLFVDL